MQSLLLADDLHQGQFVSHGLKYESIPTRLLSVFTSTDEIANEASSCDVVFFLSQNLQLVETLLPYLSSSHRVPFIVVLAQYHDPLLFEYVQSKKIHRFFLRPFPFRSIANEIRTLVYRQREESSYQVLKVRDLELNRDLHEVRWKGQTIHLRHKEFVLLEFLMLNTGKLLSRETILESVWDRNANIFTNTVDVHINKLRKKIDYNVSEKFIHTVHCSGYIFS